MIPIRFAVRGLAALALLAGSIAATAAPWQWRDADGRMVYSDRAPPAEVRASQILRSPDVAAQPAGMPAPAAAGPTPSSGESANAVADTAQANAPAARASASAAPDRASSAPTWVEREAAFRQRKAEREAAEAKANEESERAAHARRACEETRRAIRTLESGLRLASVNAAGEAETLDDAQRATRLAAARSDLERNCTAR